MLTLLYSVLLVAVSGVCFGAADFVDFHGKGWRWSRTPLLIASAITGAVGIMVGWAVHPLTLLILVAVGFATAATARYVLLFRRLPLLGWFSCQEPPAEVEPGQQTETGPPEEMKVAITYTFIVEFDGRERRILQRWEKREIRECPELLDRFDSVALDMKEFRRRVMLQGEPAIRKVKDDSIKWICFAHCS